MTGVKKVRGGPGYGACRSACRKILEGVLDADMEALRSVGSIDELWKIELCGGKEKQESLYKITSNIRRTREFEGWSYTQLVM